MNNDVKLQGHTPVSSAGPLVEVIEQAPGTGTGPGIASAAGDIEDIEGYVLSGSPTVTESVDLAELSGLPDIAWASYGAPEVPVDESIIGIDDRVQVTATADYRGGSTPRC
ncbi:hypothetical protein [Nocardia aurea]|uniref:Uncharacterized protein n=1 Tax=Nocardia aurea TaxID=2144174 RepID=A0ABV3FVZ5_9NOCA